MYKLSLLMRGEGKRLGTREQGLNSRSKEEVDYKGKNLLRGKHSSQIMVIVIRSGKVCSGETAEHGTHHLTILWKVQWVAKVLFHIALKDEREGSAVEHSAMVDKEMAKITLGFGSFHNKVRKLGSNRVQDAEDEDNKAGNGGGWGMHRQ